MNDTTDITLPMDDEAEEHLDALAHLARHDAARIIDGATDATEHEERLQRLLADSERMVIAVGRSYLRDGRRLEVIRRQCAAMIAEFDSLEAPLIARREQAQTFLVRAALAQRELSHGKDNTLAIPTVGHVRTRRRPYQVKVIDAEAFIAALPEDERDDLAPYPEPKPPQRQVDARAVKKQIEAEVDLEIKDLTPEQLAELAKVGDDERERRLDAIRAEVVAAYTGVTFEPTQIGATIEVQA
jgi:hypothetical protein